MSEINYKKLKKGFTLIELLIVLAIISLFARIILVSASSSNTRAKKTIADSQLQSIKIGFQSYFFDHNDFPPLGVNHCDACWAKPDLVPYADGYWSDIVDILVSEKIIKNRIDTDPWGNPYYYDKNFKQPCNAWSVVCSAGPNKVLETDICQNNSVVGGDDICIWFQDKDPWPLN